MARSRIAALDAKIAELQTRPAVAGQAGEGLRRGRQGPVPDHRRFRGRVIGHGSASERLAQSQREAPVLRRLDAVEVLVQRHRESPLSCGWVRRPPAAAS
jgi:hypothetical protein